METQPQQADTRGVREIVLAIEARLAGQPAATPDGRPSRSTRSPKYHPRRLPKATRDAVELVLDDFKATGRRASWKDFRRAVADLEPSFSYDGNGGDFNASIRNLCAERCGIDVNWAAEKR